MYMYMNSEPLAVLVLVLVLVYAPWASLAPRAGGWGEKIAPGIH